MASLASDRPLLAVALDISGPVAAYRLWTKGPDDILSTEFATGTDQGPLTVGNPAAALQYPLALPALALGSVLLYDILLQGTRELAYRVVLTLSQAAPAATDVPTVLAGLLDAAGQARLQGQLPLA